MTRSLQAAMILGALLSSTAAIAQDRTAQARINYQAVLAGTKQIGQLSAQEQADIAEFDRRLRAQKPDDRTPDQRCIDAEIRREGGTVSTLARRVIEMKCREAGS
ncbi:hypothetical protein [Novosphingobium sp. JCM 18896]|uniref:hypothetical protein n=1 Tax=Novosphingobium sp. JCM 18896 TaxID=2989731 RepID=UPI0022220BFB|nr:hypothetical protein [Novosphingobium sp. JCM 18896]MCW1429868.1 hypothetical protein [Novosphingobium sp. JCM 18896]